MTPDVSVIVATFNRAGQTSQCVDCLLDQDIPRERYEVLVVDDGSTDDTAGRLQERANAGTIGLVRLPARSGRGPARNAALERARGRIVVFIDSDAYAPPGFLRAHLAAHDRTPDALVDGPAISVRTFAPSVFGARWVRLLAVLDVAGESFVTANASCARSAIDRAGRFDPRFGLRYGWEDVDLGDRLRALGLRRVKARDAWVVHEDRPGDLAAEGLKQEECGTNAILYYEKNRTRAAAKRIRADALRRERTLLSAGLSPERLARFCGRSGARGPVRHLAAQAYLLHRYAAGLRQGLAECGLSTLS